MTNANCILSLEIDLISEVQTGNKLVYRITQKGRKFLSFYIQMQKMLPVGIEDLNGQYFPFDANAI
ncbi:hypothetical protein [Nitrososphaera sp. AFS]|uniref:hypothetical protein n=1 Tax=Nitrososphaera sp. AFS TaxID=2301191 RepID=UPI0013923A6C|nr:hypothetical protein [Nitrososphaera sp. AFS]